MGEVARLAVTERAFTDRVALTPLSPLRGALPEGEPLYLSIFLSGKIDLFLCFQGSTQRFPPTMKKIPQTFAFGLWDFFRDFSLLSLIFLFTIPFEHIEISGDPMSFHR